MSYQIESVSQIYGDQNYLAHKIKGATPAEDLNLFGMRVPSFGIINFGTMAAQSTKNFTPIDNDITSDIQLVSIYDFTGSPSNDEINFKLFSGSTEILERRLTNNEMPYEFPPGAIINPNLTIQVRPRYSTTQLLIYWQPVHVLSYIQVQ